MRQHIIVGGGIAGIVTAYYLTQKGYSVKLLETAATIGGLLASKRINGRFYDHGTHILAETGIDKLDEFLFDGLSCDYLQYVKVGAYIGKLYDRNGLINDFSFSSDLRRRMMDAFLSHPRCSEPNPKNLKDQLINDYGPLIYETLLEPTLKKLFHSDPQSLTPDSHSLFGMKRMMLGDEEISRVLKADPHYDRLLGFHNYTEGNPGNSSLYPRDGGVGAWVKFLESKLKCVGVEIITEAEFDLEFSNGRIHQLTVNGATYSVDKLYWTVPLAPVYDKLGMQKPAGLPPKRLTSVVVDVEIQGHYATDLFYVQNYDPSLQSFRVTLYDNYNICANDTVKRASVEFLVESDRGEDSFYEAQAMLELRQIGIVENGATMNIVGCEFIRGGFPVPTNEFAITAREYVEGLKGVSNLILFGKATGRTWFMADVIREIDQYFLNENNI